MSFTGKATYSSGQNLPTIAEDVSDLISIISPYETPLLDALGESMREATSTYHEWLEDSLLPNKDEIGTNSWTDPETDTTFYVKNGDRFRVGDQIMVDGYPELILVISISGNQLTVQRGYAGTASCTLAYNMPITIIGNAALEGSEKPTARFSTRSRKGNYTQIFTSAVEVSGSDLASSQLGLNDEMDFQKQERLREIIRDLENTVINGGVSQTKPE